MAFQHYYPLVTGPFISFLNVISAPLGVYSLCCQVCSCTKLNQSQEPSLPSQVPHLPPGWREAIIAKCLAQGHKWRKKVWRTHTLMTQLTRTLVPCSKPLGHNTPHLLLIRQFAITVCSIKDEPHTFFITALKPTKGVLSSVANMQPIKKAPLSFRKNCNKTHPKKAKR